jgi:DNA-binding transcriptional LysR family regulator
MSLKLKQVEAFRAVIRAGSMTAAANALSLGQPAISYQIASLESAIGFALFTRSGGKVTPTPEAMQLLTEVDRVYDGLSGIEAAARDIANHQHAKLRVLLTSAFSNASVLGAIGRFAASHHGMRVDIDVAHRPIIIRNVANGLADFGIVSLPVSAPNIAIAPLFSTDVVCVMQESHPLSQLSCITPQELRDYPLIAMKPGGLVRPLVDRWFEAAGCHSEFDYEVRDAWIAIELVRAGLGATIVTRLSALSYANATGSVLRMAPLDALENIEVGAIWPSGSSSNRAALSLLKFLQKESGAERND